ncbi:MAG: hypothetical protein OXH83_02755 [Bryobacterales bacterium]|nr:hypothetical protein [Bryobacterales bacterium]
MSKERRSPIELAWFPGHQLHDFACVYVDEQWEPETRMGELFRIEAKSMNQDADESKAHFDALPTEVEDYDALLLLVWGWTDVGNSRICPKIIDSFFGYCRPIIDLRDALHVARGGTFVSRNNCPDACSPVSCTHHGEPLNEKGKRERRTGPDSTRPSTAVPYSANFGGLVRMLKTRTERSKTVFRSMRKQIPQVDEYISFIHRNFPNEERNHYSTHELRSVGRQLGIDTKDKNKTDLHAEIRTHHGTYRTLLRDL